MPKVFHSIPTRFVHAAITLEEPICTLSSTLAQNLQIVGDFIHIRNQTPSSCPLIFNSCTCKVCSTAFICTKTNGSKRWIRKVLRSQLIGCSPAAGHQQAPCSLVRSVSDLAIADQKSGRRPWNNCCPPRKGPCSLRIRQSELVFTEHVCQDCLQDDSNIKPSRTRLGHGLAWPSFTALGMFFNPVKRHNTHQALFPYPQ